MKKTFIFLVISLWTCEIGFAQTTFNLNQSNGFGYNQNKQLQSLPSINSSFEANYHNSSSASNWTFANTTASQPYLLNYNLDSTSIKQKWYRTDTGKSLIVAGGLVTVGTIMHFDDSFKVGVRDEINRYLPNFEDKIDDITQYVPIAATFALDAAGVRSKHSQMRKLSTLATMTATSLIVTNGLKYSIAEPRPDGSSNNSFPSGHTTTAFMGAHMFHKEYKDKSPLYSIAAYTLAAVTGVFRQLNNRHWISDVFAGAGLGIGVTEFSYYLNDRWWKENGINEIETLERTINESKPSFIGAKVAFASLVESTDANEPGLSSKNGFRITAEGAYFLTKNFGIGGEIGFQSFPQDIDPTIQQEFNAAGAELLPQSAGNRMYYAGVYYQIPFGKNSIGTKFHLGAISGPSTKIFVRELGQDTNDLENRPEEYIYADYEPATTFSWATGLYFKRVISKNLAIGVYADYNQADLKYGVTVMDQFNNGAPTYLPKESKTTNYDSYAIGANLNIMLW
jgi:membrane-associated phospholipid phosphatase